MRSACHTWEVCGAASLLKYSVMTSFFQFKVADAAAKLMQFNGLSGCRPNRGVRPLVPEILWKWDIRCA
jgi:hypothetical protein